MRVHRHRPSCCSFSCSVCKSSRMLPAPMRVLPSWGFPFPAKQEKNKTKHPGDPVGCGVGERLTRLHDAVAKSCCCLRSFADTFLYDAEAERHAV